MRSSTSTEGVDLDLFSSLHVSIGLAIIAVVVGEYLGASSGIGYVIAQAEEVFDQPASSLG